MGLHRPASRLEVPRRSPGPWPLLWFACACGSPDRPPPIGGRYVPAAPDVDAGDAAVGGAAGSGGVEGRGGRPTSTGGRPTSSGASGGEGGAAGAGAARDAGAGGSAGASPVEDGGAEPDGGAAGGCDRGAFSGNADLYRQAQVATYAGYTEITGGLYIGTNIANPTNTVIDLTALRCLERVDSLTLIETPLASLAGLEGLSTVGLVDITNSPNLTSLDGFDQLTVTGNLKLGVNVNLSDLGGDTSIVTVAGIIDEFQNPALDRCLLGEFSARVGATCQCAPSATCVP